MVRVRVIFASLAVALACSVATARQDSTPAPPTLSPPTPPRPVVVPHPDPLPSAPDAPVPDLGSLPTVPDKSKSLLRRKLSQLVPHCSDGVISTCWSLPAGVPGPALTEAEREFAKDIEAGDVYFKNRNYRGAEQRYWDALKYRRYDPETTFKLAQSIDKQGRREEAREAYEAYLELQPNGQFADKARKALTRPEKTVKKK